MSLNYDLSKIANYKQLCIINEGTPEQRMSPITDAMIWVSLFCGFNHIDEANAEAVALRIDMFEQTRGQMLAGREITYRDVVQHIGLKTNATPLTLAEFKKQVWRRVEEDARDRVRRTMKEMKNEPSSPR